jgi:hypothetical protein
MRNRAAILVSLAATLLAAAATPALADDVVADDLTRDTPIAARSGVLAWSRYDEASGHYSLMLEGDGAAARAPIAPSLRPFDVSLGSDRRGRLVALYTRCATAKGKRCDVYRYDVRTATEVKVKAVSGPTEDEAWPVQSGDLLAFARRRPFGLPKRAEIRDCDLIFVKRLSSRAPSRRLDRGACSKTTGLSIRGTRIVQVTVGSPPTETRFASQVRLLSARGGAVKVLARRAFGEESNIFGSPSQSATSIWLTHTGAHTTPSFARLDIASRRLTEVPARIGISGSFARDEQQGTFFYVETPESFSEDCGDAGSAPCRLTRADPSPFSTAERVLTPVMSIASSANTGKAVFGDPFAVSGRLTRTVVRRGQVLRSNPIAGARVRLLRRVPDSSRPDGLKEGFEPTALMAITGADGGWTIPIAVPPARPWFSAVTEGQPERTFAGRGTVGSVDARITLTVAGGTFAGTVTPAQPGRTVKVQRLVKRTCQTATSGQQFCQEQWATVADAPLNAAGTGFAATVAAPAPGIYTAALPFADQQADPEAYAGRSPEITIGG